MNIYSILILQLLSFPSFIFAQLGSVTTSPETFAQLDSMIHTATILNINL